MAKASDLDVAYVSKLARLNLTDEETQLFQKQLADVLKYAEKLGEVDVSHVEAAAHAIPIFNVFREDEARGGRGPIRQNKHGRIRDGLVHGKLERKSNAQSVGHVARSWRFQRRLGRGGRSRLCFRRTGHRHRWINSATCFPLWRRRRQTK